ncbi:uncharacterized protein LOC107434962 isoform X2 [Ziziphus jujuba]|uniref:Uncharacterized protein LOC107434962 isoform X2 n=1 Tax=Ziziphus jujuba TaxID=326968 RepID=A0A6P4AWW7_ZIZJJ|nr:uncharacterized protein LOC107434962 isoform X2 [Ziziphus jujuba]
MDEAAEPSIAQLLGRKRGKTTPAANSTKKQTRQTISATTGETFPPSPPADQQNCKEDSHGCRFKVSLFDESVENHFRAMDTISKLCREPEEGSVDQSEIQRLSSSITFLREWKLFNYETRNVKFADEAGSPEGKNGFCGINLPQFSSATIPKKEGLSGDAASMEPRDFVMYVGGSLWAMDWCPRIHDDPDSHVKCEFIAIAAHPPGSSYHKIGVPLSGRGLVQIWCLLNASMNEGDDPPLEKPKQGRKKHAVAKEKPIEIKRPRGRPRKKLLEKPVGDMDGNSHHIEAPAIQVSQDPSLLLIEGVPGNAQGASMQGYSGEKQNCHDQLASARNPALRSSKDEADAGNHNNDMSEQLISQNEHNGSSISSHQIQISSGEDPAMSNNVHSLLEMTSTRCSIPEDVALPRVVLCLAHNGKVAWDVKWRPSNINNPKYKHRMGYLAVLLGNGSLEVWEVSLPHAMRAIYSSSHGEGTDPRFVKLEPIFRGSKLKSGGIQSIPLTVEWSTSPPHDYLVVGCHDGTVALWKFSASVSSKDTRPLLCFSADTVPIRALAWSPFESNSESANVILTASHGGLKFWDLRDPFRPLWDLHPVPRIIYSLDWIPDPSCVVLSFDDGTMRILSLMKAANDVPVTGKPFVGTKQQGLHSYWCSSFAIWSIQVSRLTGMVAYCGEDGTVIRFQLTSKEVEKDHSRYRVPHFLCGSMTEEESFVTINTPEANAPFPLKKELYKGGYAPIAMRVFTSESRQVKKAHDKMGKCSHASDDQTLRLCCDVDDADPEVEYDSDEKLASVKKKRMSKSGLKRKQEDEQSLVGIDEEQASKNEEVEASNGFETFPSKVVAMHKVRWNMNKGSERWLCYGGAAGVVRCQEIISSYVHGKGAMKK